MSKILIIDGHPDPAPERLNHALAEAYAKAAHELGHEVRTIGLAGLDFPLMRTQADFVQGTPVAAIQAAQDCLKWADHYAFFFPLWIGDMPALLKAFMEQTFRPGVAMEYAGRHRPPKQLLRGKTARIVVTMGMPAVVYRRLMGAYALKALERIFQFAGVGPVRETIIGGIEGAGESKKRGWFATIAANVKADTSRRRRSGGKFLRSAMRAGLAASAVYAGYTLSQWARYGSVRSSTHEDEMLDGVMPDYEVCVRHGITVNAGAGDAFDTI